MFPAFLRVQYAVLSSAIEYFSSVYTACYPTYSSTIEEYLLLQGSRYPDTTRLSNHQYELTKKYSELGYILSATDYEELKKCLNDISDFELKFKNNNKKSKVKEEILNFINN